MIRLNDFFETFKLYLEGKIDEIVLKDIFRTNPFDLLCNPIKAKDVTSDFIIKVLISERRNVNIKTSIFTYFFGDDIFICETKNDLKEVKGCDFEWAKTHNNRWPDCTDIPMSWDIADYIDNDPNTGWACLMICWNDAGGSLYYIPKILWSSALIEQHINKSKTFWNSTSE
jgi:hypothetical protein